MEKKSEDAIWWNGLLCHCIKYQIRLMEKKNADTIWWNTGRLLCQTTKG
jgi:hypothetical protein